MLHEYANDKSNIGLSFAPDWFLMWHKFSTSIVEQSEAKPTEGNPDSFRQQIENWYIDWPY